MVDPAPGVLGSPAASVVPPDARGGLLRRDAALLGAHPRAVAFDQRGVEVRVGI